MHAQVSKSQGYTNESPVNTEFIFPVSALTDLYWLYWLIDFLRLFT